MRLSRLVRLGCLLAPLAACSKREEPVAPGGARAPASQAEVAAAGLGTGYWGKLGFSAKCPPGYLFAALEKDDKGYESIVYYPEGLAKAGPKAILSSADAVRLEAMPREGLTLADWRVMIEKTLTGRKEAFRVAARAGALPGFKVSITAPTAMTQIMLDGKRGFYLLTAAKDGPALDAAADGVAEGAPRP